MLQTNNDGPTLVDAINKGAVQVKDVRVFFQTAPNVLRVFFIYEFFWFCMEGESVGSATDVNIANIRARGSFIDRVDAMNSIPAEWRSLISDKQFLIAPR